MEQIKGFGVWKVRYSIASADKVTKAAAPCLVEEHVQAMHSAHQSYGARAVLDARQS